MANVICDFRSFAEKASKCLSCRRRYPVQVAVIKDDASKDMFPAYRKKCLADKRTIVVFGEKLKDRSFNVIVGM